MYTVLLYTALGFLAFLMLGFLFAAESKAGHRLVLPRLRDRLDSFALSGHKKISHMHFHLGTGAVRLLFHYCTHKILAVTLLGAKRLEDTLTRLLRQNRNVAKVVREEQNKNHLDHIADHKVDVSLSVYEKARRRAQAIAGDE